MCGIAGFWGDGSKEVLLHMTSSIVHRGPDASGIFYEHGVGLGHRRLSIVDVSPTGAQPMQTSDTKITLVFNGEIYNHKELREQYLKGVPFVGTSDTEVIVYLYEKFGRDFLSMLRGMFALAIFDERTHTMLLARDRMGEKPLFWTRSNNTLMFGSELKVLREHPLCPHTLNQTALGLYLMHEYVPAPQTIYDGVYKLLPGSFLEYDGKNVHQGTFAHCTPNHGSRSYTLSEEISSLQDLLQKSVADMMVADVPVGIFLSGGVDSSTVAYFAQKNSTTPIETFSIGFEDAAFNESGYAREVATFLGTKHHERIVTASDLTKNLERIATVLDEPMADSSILPTMLLSEFARQHVTVALGGDGADEVFWGYGTFFAHKAGLLYEHTPHLIQKGISSLANQLPVSHGYMSFDFKLKKFLSGFDGPRSRRNATWLSACTAHEIKALLECPISEELLFAHIDALYARRQSFWDSVTAEYLEGYLAGDILVKTDRASMAHSLEVRAPFLDTRIVDFALGLKPEYKYHGKTGKYILKRAMEGLLPRHILYRSKQGFNIPIGGWIKGAQRQLFEDVLLGGPLVASGLFKQKSLAILMESHVAGKVDNRKKLWSLFVLALWMEKWYVRN